MAILARDEIPGLTVEQFNEVFAPLLERVKTFQGFIMHANGPTATGYQVTEIWETQEDQERWLREAVRPVARGIGLDNLPPSQYVMLNQYLMR